VSRQPLALEQNAFAARLALEVACAPGPFNRIFAPDLADK